MKEITAVLFSLLAWAGIWMTIIYVAAKIARLAWGECSG